MEIAWFCSLLFLVRFSFAASISNEQSVAWVDDQEIGAFLQEYFCEDSSPTKPDTSYREVSRSELEAHEGSLINSKLLADIQSSLLAKYRKLFRFDSQIRWSKVEVVGWPQEIIFYRKDTRTALELKLLLDAIDGITFVVDTKFYPSMPVKDRLKIKFVVQEFFKHQFKSVEIDWRLVKEQIPNFHLSHPSYSKWSSKDAATIEAAILFFKEKNPVKLLSKRSLEADDTAEQNSLKRINIDK